MGKRKRYVVNYLCLIDSLPCANFDLVLGVGVCELNGVVCYRFTLKNSDRVLEIEFDGYR